MNTDIELLLVIESNFHLSGRGHVHVVDFAEQHATIRVGDRVVAVMPDGVEIETTMTAIEFIDGRDSVSRAPKAWLGVMFQKVSLSGPLPAGTKIYRRGEGEKPR